MKYRTRNKNIGFFLSGVILAALLLMVLCVHTVIFFFTRARDAAVETALSTISYTEEAATEDLTVLTPFANERFLSAESRGNLYKAMTEIAYMSGDNTLYNHHMGYALYYLEQAGDTESVVYLTNKYIGILYANGCYAAAEQVLQGLAEDYDISSFSPDMQASYYLSCADVSQMLGQDDKGTLESAQAAITQMPETSAKKLQQAKLDLLTARDCIQNGDYAQAEKIMADYDEFENFGMSGDQVYVVCDYRIPYYEISAKLSLYGGNLDSAYAYANRYIDVCDSYSFRVMKLRMLQSVVDATRTEETPKAESYRNMEAITLRESMTEMSNAYGQFLLSDMEQTIQRIGAREETSRQLLWKTAVVVGLLYMLLLVYCVISFVIRSASKDELTGLSNRKRYDRQVRLCMRKKLSYGLLVLDIDDFKKVNDRLGHQAGDTVLRNVAGTLLRYEGRGISSYRYGGEELCTIMIHVPEQRIREIAEEIRAKVEQDAGGAENHVTVSGGIGFSRHGEDAFADADQNLYKAKTQGKNCVIG